MNTRRTLCVALLLCLTVPLFAQRPPDFANLANGLAQSPAELKAQYTKALEDYRKKNDAHGEAITLMMLGMAELALNNVEGGRNHLQNATKKMEAQN
ncbi:MAG TPA: hypothetical protein VF846_09965, partial [Thermoanaerobaculia bacterium]